jgi:hypothetical protein
VSVANQRHARVVGDPIARRAGAAGLRPVFMPVTTRPRASLRRVLEDLGTTLLDLVCGDPDHTDELGGVVIHDPLDEPVPPPRALVLGVGVQDPGEIARLLDDLGAHRAAGLVVRAPVTVTEEVAAAARRSGLALLALTRGASWAQLAAMVRSLIAEGDIGEDGPETLGGMHSGDLFAVANAVAALLDAPITIEDRNSRVLAFSGRQDEADTSRVETILGRQVPGRFTRILEDRGVFQALYRSDQPVYVQPVSEEGAGESALPRVALAVRAGDEILGSIWAAVHGPLSAERMQALCDGGKIVALHMMRLRAGADVERRLRADLVSTALEGGTGSGEALRRLGLADHGGVVLALAPAGGSDEEVSGVPHAHLVAERQRVADAFAMHLTAIHPNSAAALVGGVAYGIVPVPPDRGDGEQRAERIATDFLDRIGNRVRLIVGVGPLVTDSASLPRSRAGADRALRVLGAGHHAQRVVRISDVTIEALLLELGDLIAERGDSPSGPVARLLEYDVKHRSRLVETLRAWLDAFGDVAAASAAVFVHPNTFRYRLRRLAEVGGLDLTDADARFAAMLQLRLLPPARPAWPTTDSSTHQDGD